MIFWDGVNSPSLTTAAKSLFFLSLSYHLYSAPCIPVFLCVRQVAVVSDRSLSFSVFVFVLFCLCICPSPSLPYHLCIPVFCVGKVAVVTRLSR